MARLKLFDALDDYEFHPNLFEGANPPTTANGTTMIFTNGDGFQITLTGTGFAYNGDTPIGASSSRW